MSPVRRRIALVGIVLGTAAGVLSAWVVVGQVATRPVVLTLFFSGFAAGAGLAAFVAQQRAARRSG